MSIDAGVIAALKQRAAQHNAAHADKVKLGALKKVYERGARSFERVMFKGKKTQSEWAFGRVDNFLFMLASGTPMDGKAAADRDLLPEDHPMKNQPLAKAGEFDESKHRRDDDGRFTSKVGDISSSPAKGSVEYHKERQQNDATYRAYTSSVLPENRITQLYIPLGSYAAGILTGSGMIGHSAYTAGTNVAGLRNWLVGRGTRLAVRAGGLAAQAPLRAIAQINKIPKGSVVPPYMTRHLPEKAKIKHPKIASEGIPTRDIGVSKKLRVNAFKAANAIDKFSKKIAPIAGDTVNYAIDTFWSKPIAAFYNASGRTPMQRLVRTSPIGLAAGVGLGYGINSLAQPIGAFYETWKPSQRIVERAERTGLLRKVAIRRALLKRYSLQKNERQFDESKHPRDEKGRWTNKHTAAVAGAAAAAALAGGLIFGRRASINAAKRVFETALKPRVGANGWITRSITQAQAKKIIGGMAFDGKISSKMKAVMERVIESSGRRINSEKLKAAFNRLAESQDRFSGAVSGVKRTLIRTETGIVSVIKATQDAAGPFLRQLGDTMLGIAKSAGVDAIKYLKDVKRDWGNAKTLTEKGKLLNGMLGTGATVIGGVYAVGSLLKAGYEAIASRGGIKIERGFNDGGFHFSLKVKSNGTYQEVIKFEKGSLSVTGFDSSSSSKTDNSPPPPPKPPLETRTMQIERLRREGKLFEMGEWVALRDERGGDRSDAMKSEWIKTIRRKINENRSDWHSRYGLAVAIARDAANMVPSEMMSAKEKMNLMEVLIGKYDIEGKQLGSNTKDFEGQRVPIFNRSSDNSEHFREDFKKYLDSYPKFLNGSQHAKALQAFVDMTHGAGYLNGQHRSELQALIVAKPWNKWRYDEQQEKLAADIRAMDQAYKDATNNPLS